MHAPATCEGAGACGLALPGASLAGAAAQADRAWALKRDWTEDAFQAGAEGNLARLREFEDALAARLRRSSAGALGGGPAPPAHDGGDGGEVLARVLGRGASPDREAAGRVRDAVLRDPEVLGSALDIVGAYLKNYAVDKAAAVVESVLPTCRQKGGLWLLKALNHLATVRMKQARPEEALTALEEVNAYATMNLSPQQREDAWEFWETVYRNFGWVLSSLGREDEAIDYIQRAIDVKERVGLPPSWFDLWDLGRMRAATALRREDQDGIRDSQSLVTRALWLHRDAEPGDLVMRAKLWHSVGECSFALGHLAERAGAGPAAGPEARAAAPAARAQCRKALKCFREAHKLFRKAEGRHGALAGGEAQAAAWALLRLGEDEEAKGPLLDALEALARQESGWGARGGRAPALLQAAQVVDRVLEAHRRTEDRGGLAGYFGALERLCANACGRLAPSRGHADAAAYERLVSSCSMVMVASGRPEAMARSQELLQRYLWDSPATPQAQLCNEMLRSLPDSDAPQAGLEALVGALARSCEVQP